ncbi:hypothetical protein PQG02_18960 [Nostoc sp. UHCC 0926]|uniref:hypothetical protein n=1 Tax=unclassified Nostoc TaxID=2593658 RepID=UPI002361B043|nr:hypothetical protein [Nostoc sp. UHCC 0926]WDD30819.1 hypothetical protein PQG02_18960 [Nostoc sp. UHCC 0926]
MTSIIKSFELLNTRSYHDISRIPNDLLAPSPSAPLPHPPPDPLLPNIELDTGTISFNNGVPVGGHAHLSLFADGAYSFTGNFHDSGATSYDTSLVFALKDNVHGSVFTFSHTGRTHGTFEAGSRDDNWGVSGTNPALAAAWGGISSSYSSSWNAGANLDLGGILDGAIKAVGLAGAVVAIL